MLVSIVNMNSVVPKNPDNSRSEIHFFLKNHFNYFAPIWFKHQSEWVGDAYKTFKDHDKFLICIYLIKKTLDRYHLNNDILSMKEFYLKDYIKINEYSISEISKSLYMTKETTRRKIVELEKIGAIKRIGKKIILNQNILTTLKPIDSTKRTAKMLAELSLLLCKQKILKKDLSSEFIHAYIVQNFSYCWRLFYELQIPIITNWKKYFKDIETWHIWTTVTSGDYIKKKDTFYSKNMKKILKNTATNIGLNAMTISNITNIPRPTVIRKLKSLIESGHLVIDKLKNYRNSKLKKKEMNNIFKKNFLIATDCIVNNYNEFISLENSFLEQNSK